MHLTGYIPYSNLTMLYSPAAGASDYRRFNGVCDYYKTKGHKRENCYRLIEFPFDFKFTKKKRTQAAMTINSRVPSDLEQELNHVDTNSQSTTFASAASAGAPVFIRDQCNQILNLLHKVPSNDTVVNLAGITTSTLSGTSGSVSWIIDTGATNHILPDFKSLHSPNSCASHSCLVHLSNCKTIPITHVGTY